MSLFKDVLGSGESLFRNELALDYSFIPKMVPFREQEQHHIASCIKPLFQQRNGRNLFISGKPGVGKTVACRHVLNELEEETEEIVPFYINCWQHNSSFKILLEICNILGYKFTQNKRSDELLIVARQMLKKKGAVFVFDEVDKLQDYDFLYTLLEDVMRKTIIAIANDSSWLASLDTRVRSRLMAENMEFKPYNDEETKGILRERIEYAFSPGVWDNDAFLIVAEKSFELKDVRRGLFLMREAALIAEQQASRKISREHVLQAIGKADDFKINPETELEDEDRFILDVIKKNSGKKIGEVYKAYQEAGGKALYRTFQRRVDKFEKGRYISVNKLVGGPEGNTSLLYFSSEKKLTDY